MIDPFLIRAGLAGLALVMASGPLGCFVLWGRMAYFGDALGHAAILGVALALALGWPVPVGTVLVALVMAVTVVQLSGRGYGADAVLGVLAHGCLALGLVAASLVPALRLNLEAFLFGDILSVGWAEVAMAGLVGAAVLALLVWRWPRLIVVAVSEEMAAASGIRPAHEKLILTLALALTVAASIRLVGTLLIAALLIIPAASARRSATTPENMAIRATIAGMLSVLGGLGLSLGLDTPAGPSIVVVALGIFILSWLLPARHSAGKTGESAHLSPADSDI